MVDALATKSCMNMQAFYFQLMSYPKEMKFIIPSNANNMGCDSVAMVTTNLAWKFVTRICPWDLCVSYALSTKLPPGKHPWALTAAKPTNYVARRWNSDVHMSRFGNCWQSCVAGHTNKLTKRWNSDVHMDRFGNCWQSCVAGQCSGESSFLQDKKTWCMWWVCRMSWCLNCIRVIAAMCVCVNSVTIPLNRPTSFQSPHNTITQIFGMVDGCTEDPIKPQNCQNCGMSTSMEWVLG